MNNESKWLYLLILGLVLVIFGLVLYDSSPLKASSTVNDFDLGYEQGFRAGYNQGYISHIEYRDIIHVEYRDIIHVEYRDIIRTEYRDIIRYVDREVIKEAVVEKPIELREFISLKELTAWLAEDDTDRYIHLLAGKDGVCRQSDKYDCDDYAYQLQRRAARSGFLTSLTIIEKQGKPHMINLTCIGNDIYHIEPQTDQVRFFCHRD